MANRYRLYPGGEALRDYDRALAAFFDPANPARKPGFRSKRRIQGFVVRDVRARRVSRHWGEVFVPKCGWVRFRWSRPLPADPGMARLTLDRAGRWHVSFSAAQPAVGRAPGPRPAVGIDRGVRTALVTSGGQHYRAPRISDRDARRYLALQRKLARQEPGSKRRDKARRKMSAVTARVVARRRDWAEKISTGLVAGHDLIVLEKLAIPAMTRKPRPKPDPDKDGAYLPNRARAKAGLNKGILASAWGSLGTRAKQKAESGADTTRSAA